MNKKLNIQISYVYIFDFALLPHSSGKSWAGYLSSLFWAQGLPSFSSLLPRYLFNPTHEV